MHLGSVWATTAQKENQERHTSKDTNKILDCVGDSKETKAHKGILGFGKTVAEQRGRIRGWCTVRSPWPLVHEGQGRYGMHPVIALDLMAFDITLDVANCLA
eukprot:3186757-Amphidinium_carterae.1